MQPATRVNYASNLAYIHGVEAMVSFATEGAVSVSGGNWQIFDNMVQSSGAALYRNTSVTSMSFDKSTMKPGAPRKYRLSTQDVGAASAEPQKFPVAFDSVVIASPWQFSGIKAQEGVLKQTIDKIPYMKLHVTLFTSPYTLRPGVFNLDAESRAPSNAYTTLGKEEEAKQGAEGVGKTGFYSISTLKRVRNPRTQQLEFVYKIFSAAAVTPEFLTDILGAEVPSTFVAPPGEAPGSAAQTISWYYPHWFHSYPIELPQVTFQDPVVGRGLYYTSGIESFISIMETSALMGMNVAKLMADHFAGTSRGSRPRPDEGRERGLRGDFFESVESEMGMNMNVVSQDEL